PPPRRRRGSRQDGGSRSFLAPAGLAEAFDHVGITLWSPPGRAIADIHVKRRAANRDGFLKRSLSLFHPAKLTEGCRKPAIGRRMIRTGTDNLSRCIQNRFVLA